MVSDRPEQWYHWLSMAEWWYNSTFHSSIKMSPFAALYGYQPIPLPIGPYYDSIVPAATHLLKDRQNMLQILKEHLTLAQSRTKQQTDKGRSERSFQIGELVYVKLQPCKQSSVMLRRNLKLSAKYYEPFVITAEIGMFAYRLQLPVGSLIQPVFHVSMLKKHVGARVTIMPQLPEMTAEGHFKLEPEAVLQRKLVLRNDQTVIQWLIRWANLPPEESTWEDKDVIEAQFTQFNP